MLLNCSLLYITTSMTSLNSLIGSLHDYPGLSTLSLSTLAHFIRLATSLKDAIILRQPPNWDSSVAPWSLPANVRTFLGARIAVSEMEVDGLWQALKDTVWQKGTLVLGDDTLPPKVLDRLAEETHLCTFTLKSVPYQSLSPVAEHMLFPPTTVCASADCVGHDKVLRWKDDPKEVVLFTMSDGVHDGLEVHLHCYSASFSSSSLLVLTHAHPECQTVYYPNYIARDNKRQYYTDMPSFIQISDHHYAETQVLEHFTMLSVLSWTSATNAAHIYHESMSKLDDDRRNLPRYHLRAEHTWDGFVLLALLRNARLHSSVLEVPHDGLQKDRFSAAMHARNEQIQRSGQPEYSHWCTKCHRRFDWPDESTSAYFIVYYIRTSTVN